MRRGAAVAVLALVGAMGSIGVSSADAAFPGRNGEVMATWLDVREKSLSLTSGISAYGTRKKSTRRVLTCFWDAFNTSPGNCDSYEGAVRGDGELVAVVVRSPGVYPPGLGYRPPMPPMNYRLALVTAAGEHVKALPLAGPSFDPAWSPDGDTLLVTRHDTASGRRPEGSPRVVAIDVADGREREVVADGGSDADWSASGEIAYVRDGEIWAARPGGAPRRVTTGGGLSPSWSPDGRMLAFERARRIWTIRADGTRARQLVDVPTIDPAWSPDGRYVAYIRPGGLVGLGLGSVWVIRADGLCPRVVRRTGAWIAYGAPFWRPLPGSASRRLGRPACVRRGRCVDRQGAAAKPVASKHRCSGARSGSASSV